MICFKRNKSLQSIDAGKPAKQKVTKVKQIDKRKNQRKKNSLTYVSGCTAFDQFGKQFQPIISLQDFL